MYGTEVYRYLLWVSYDGSRFLSIANRSTSHGVLGFLKTLVRDTFPDIGKQLKMSQSSRTDAGVHALRNAFIMQIPIGNADENKSNLLYDWNRKASEITGGSLRVLDFHTVSKGFCSKGNVSYRKYKYRLALAENEDEWFRNAEQPLLWQFAERPYMWFLPNGFDIRRAADACSLFQGTHNMASFMKYPRRDRLRSNNRIPTMRHMLHVGISGGGSRFGNADGFNLIDINVVSRSFLRSQIRHMVRTIIEHAYGRLSRERLVWFLNNPNPENFHHFGMVTAPPQGLFLEDVVYDERIFYHCAIITNRRTTASNLTKTSCGRQPLRVTKHVLMRRSDIELQLKKENAVISSLTRAYIKTETYPLIQSGRGVRVSTDDTRSRCPAHLLMEVECWKAVNNPLDPVWKILAYGRIQAVTRVAECVAYGCDLVCRICEVLVRPGFGSLRKRVFVIPRGRSDSIDFVAA
uniref:tRNA pseudouridine synthase n=1 Tax=Setaria digitata TaxID=48799 RepID=A0A915PTW7_9BILA